MDLYPAIEPYIDEILPKKDDLLLSKCSNKITLISVGTEPLFFQDGDGPFIPCLRLIHKCTFYSPIFSIVPIDVLSRVQVDKGAIKFILQGADIMAPGLTSAGGVLPNGLAKDQIVAVHAEGKEHALCIGKMLASTDEIKNNNSGHAIINLHCLCDGLWKVEKTK